MKSEVRNSDYLSKAERGLQRLLATFDDLSALEAAAYFGFKMGPENQIITKTELSKQIFDFIICILSLNRDKIPLSVEVAKK